MLKILFLGLVLVLHKTSGDSELDDRSYDDVWTNYLSTLIPNYLLKFFFHIKPPEEWDPKYKDCIKYEDLIILKQELLDEIGDKIQATMMDAGKGNPNHDPDHDEYPNPDDDLDHDEYPNPDHDPDFDEYPDNQDQYPNQEYSEQKLVTDSPKFQLTG